MFLGEHFLVFLTLYHKEPKLALFERISLSCNTVSFSQLSIIFSRYAKMNFAKCVFFKLFISKICKIDTFLVEISSSFDVIDMRNDFLNKRIL